MFILAIDPGNIESAYCVIHVETLKPAEFGKIENDKLRCRLDGLAAKYKLEAMAIEMIASYGMPVGATVFDTCVWIGRFKEVLFDYPLDIEYIYRKDEKMHICGTMKAKDSNIRQALIDRFGVVGTKKNQGFFYGFKSDIWAAYAVGITYIETKMGVKN